MMTLKFYVYDNVQVGGRNLFVIKDALVNSVFKWADGKPVTFAMVQNQFEEYQLIGTPLEADMETVDRLLSLWVIIWLQQNLKSCPWQCV